MPGAGGSRKGGQSSPSLFGLTWELWLGEGVDLLLHPLAQIVPRFLALFGQDPGSGLSPQELNSSKVTCLLQAFRAYVLISSPHPPGL